MLRFLDAIHLVSAASVTAEIGALITYYRRMFSEARELDLPVVAPA